MELRFRPARPEDVPELVALLAADSLGSTREALEPGPGPESLAAFEEIAADPRQERTVVELAGELAGTFQLTRLRYLTYRGGERLLVEGVRVRADLRGRGVGRRMSEHIRERALALGCHMVQLTSDKRRPDARRFYESLGYVASHEGFKLHLSRGEGEVSGSGGPCARAGSKGITELTQKHGAQGGEAGPGEHGVRGVE